MTNGRIACSRLACLGVLNIVQEIISQDEREITIKTDYVRSQLDNWRITFISRVY